MRTLIRQSLTEIVPANCFDHWLAPAGLTACSGSFLGRELPPDLITHFVNSAGYDISRFFAAGWSENQANTEANSYACDKPKCVTEDVVVLSANGFGCSRYPVRSGFKFFLGGVTQIRKAIGSVVPNSLRSAVRLLK
jgi:hypothetical protein